MNDARFEDGDGAGRAIQLRAEEAEDLPVISALVQDAIFPGSEISWRASDRRFALLINRFRWEGEVKTPERVRSVLAIEDVSHVASQGVTRDADTVFALLSLNWEPGEDGTGALELVLSGDGGFRLSVECLNLTLTDVTQPYHAPSRKTPEHPQ